MAAGETWLELDSLQGLAAGQILRLGPPARQGFARIAVVLPDPVNPAGPGLVLLGGPLAVTARQGDAAEACTLGPPAAAATATLGQGFAGEAVLLTAAAAPGEVLVLGPAASGAVHGRPAPTDADGQYRIAGLARVPRFTATVAAAGFAAQSRAVVPTGSPAAGTTRIDWRLIP
ncbi:hypothetical protein [Siccirubricoccus sp. G192]|uniref:hypothetical protein n=1 Tax=Siccirubricoccus sp. G192 TaxID=2849651 RepID=UPI001C2C8D3E|nr:hypothetical protein [Siccirubricoccus sp. G192]MBV1796841.1 hypothetical protein [Siccirubricoccus sp. G192]